MFAPVDRLDIAKLEPVEAIAFYKAEEEFVLETDTGAKGEGMTTLEALNDLKENTPAVVYLDTAQYLLVSRDAEAALADLRPYLRPEIKVADYAEGDIGWQVKYLDAHMEKSKPFN